jgi:hypothetical protein
MPNKLEILIKQHMHQQAAVATTKAFSIFNNGCPCRKSTNHASEIFSSQASTGWFNTTAGIPEALHVDPGQKQWVGDVASNDDNSLPISPSALHPDV